MPDTGWILCATFSSEDNGTSTDWTDPGNAGADDGAYANQDVVAYQDTDWLRCLLGANAPDLSGQEIDGVEVRYKVYAEVADKLRDDSIRLRDGVSGQLGDDLETEDYYPTSEGDEDRGSGASDAATGWAGADIDGNVGVDISVDNTETITARFVYIDAVYMKFTYSEPAESAVLPGGMNTYRRRRV